MVPLLAGRKVGNLEPLPLFHRNANAQYAVLCCDKNRLPVPTHVNLFLQVPAKGRGQYSRDRYTENPWDSGWIKHDILHDVRTYAAAVSLLCAADSEGYGQGYILASICFICGSAILTLFL